jgi:gliding motility-associated-like protein
MHRLYKFLLLVAYLIVTNPHPVFSQNQLTNQGTDFWVGYGPNLDMSKNFGFLAPNITNLVIYVCNMQNKAAQVTIELDSSAAIRSQWWRQTLVVPANSMATTACMPKGPNFGANFGGTYCGTTVPNGKNYDARLIDAPLPAGTGGEGIFRKKGIHITSNIPVSVYAYTGAGVGSSFILPTANWGYAYTTLQSQQTATTGTSSYFYVIAKENNTVVKITPSQKSSLGKAAHQPYYVTLHKGWIYQCRGAQIISTTSAESGVQLTGSKIEAAPNRFGICYPIGVFAGSEGTQGETDFVGGNNGGCDYFQCYPESSWGKTFFTVPLSNTNLYTTINPTSLITPQNITKKYIYKIAVKDSTTLVKLNGVLLTGLKLGTFYEYESSTADYIEADKPIMVAQYLVITGIYLGYVKVHGFCMIYLTPMEQALHAAKFFRTSEDDGYQNPEIWVNYVTLIVKTGALATLRIDGGFPPYFNGSANHCYSYPHPQNPNYTVVVKGWLAAKTQCTINCDSGFVGITYGIGQLGYAYSIGGNFNNQLAKPLLHNVQDTTHTATTHPFAFANAPAKLRVQTPFKVTRINWQFSKITNKNMVDIVRLSDSAINKDTMLVAAAGSHLPPQDSVIGATGTVLGYIYECPGTYYFNKKMAVNIFDTANIPIEIFTNIPWAFSGFCQDSLTAQTITIQYAIHQPIKPVFTYQKGNCINDSVRFLGPNTANSFKVLQWKWTFDDGSISLLQNPVKYFTKGNHIVKLEVLVATGGLGSSTQIILQDSSLTDINVSTSQICKGAKVTATSLAISNLPITNYYYDFGDGSTPINATNSAVATHIYNQTGTFIIKHTISVLGNNCALDTIKKQIIITGKMFIDFALQNNCLAATDSAKFSVINNVGNSSIVAYNWNFGDAASGVNNVSTMATPKHFYNVEDSFVVGVNIVDTNGCNGDTTKKIAIAKIPLLTFPYLPSVCVNGNAVSVDVAKATNGVAAQKIYYTGKGVDSVGNFNPKQAGEGIHTITFTFITKAGCVNFITQKIKVLPAPKTVIVSRNNVCADSTITLFDNSSISSGNIVSRSWNFGDGVTTAINPPFNQYKITYTKAQTYTVSLTVTSDSGCVNSDTQAITVQPKPLAKFGFNEVVCLPNGVVNFNNLSSVNNSAGTLTYSWNFGDILGATPNNLNNSSLAHPSHIYASNGNNKVLLTATNSSFGCWDTVSKILQVSNPFYDKPTASFITLKDTLCQGVAAVFIDKSTAPGSYIDNRIWDFGDNSVPNSTKQVTQNYTFAKPGVYDVTLQVFNQKSCPSDTAHKTVYVYPQPKIYSILPPNNQITFLQGTHTLQLHPKINDSTFGLFTYNWRALLPNTGTIQNANSLHPTITTNATNTYKLSITGAANCTTDGLVIVKILGNIIIPNAFSPNGDGINDTWDISNLKEYGAVSVDVFDRYGSKVWSHIGYDDGSKWNGNTPNNAGAPLPVGTYYYIIKPEWGLPPMVGWVIILR